MTVGATVHRQTHRNALGFGQQATLDPAFAAVILGLGPVFPPAQGRFGHGAVQSEIDPKPPLSQLQSSPFSSAHSVPVGDPPATAGFQEHPSGW